MCDYSLHATASRPAKAGDRLISTSFARTVTRGFAAETDRRVAVCLLPGTELSFAQDVKYYRNWFWPAKAGFSVARFCKIEASAYEPHRDALEFPDGKVVRLTALVRGQRAQVLQLPPQAKAERQSSLEGQARPRSSSIPTKTRLQGGGHRPLPAIRPN
jgi:hypothetical protein